MAQQTAHWLPARCMWRSSSSRSMLTSELGCTGFVYRLGRPGWVGVVSDWYHMWYHRPGRLTPAPVGTILGSEDRVCRGSQHSWAQSDVVVARRTASSWLHSRGMKESQPVVLGGNPVEGVRPQPQRVQRDREVRRQLVPLTDEGAHLGGREAHTVHDDAGHRGTLNLGRLQCAGCAWSFAHRINQRHTSAPSRLDPAP